MRLLITFYLLNTLNVFVKVLTKRWLTEDTLTNNPNTNPNM